MVKEIKAELIGKQKSFGIVVSRFNDFITSKLVEGAVDTLTRHGVSDNSIDIVYVPGSFEIPQIAQKMARSKKYDAIICLGTLIKGDTPHFDYIASIASKGIAKVSMDTDIPCIFGIITAESLEQAIERAGTKSGNKGRDAAISAIEMANLSERLKK